MTFKKILTDEKIELAIEMVNNGSQPKMVAKALGVSYGYLRERVRLYKINSGQLADSRLGAFRQPPLAKQPKDTRSYSDRLQGNPLPGRSALDRLREQQPDQWQMMDISAIPTSSLYGHREDA